MVREVGALGVWCGLWQAPSMIILYSESSKGHIEAATTVSSDHIRWSDARRARRRRSSDLMARSVCRLRSPPIVYGTARHGMATQGMTMKQSGNEEGGSRHGAARGQGGVGSQSRAARSRAGTTLAAKLSTSLLKRAPYRNPARLRTARAGAERSCDSGQFFRPRRAAQPRHSAASRSRAT